MAGRNASRRHQRLAWAGAVLALSVAGSLTSRGEQDIATATVADRLRAYLEEHEPSLSALVAEERFEQAITTANSEGTTQLRNRRVLVSEIGFLRLPDEQAWLGHRRVQSINGRPVRGDAPRLADLFTRVGADRLVAAKQIADENARHNLGHPRTTNVPTLPLDLLHPSHRSAYTVSMGRIDRRQGVGVARLEFREGAKGSVVAYDDRSFVRTLVTAWVEVDSGALQRAEVTLIPPVVARENHVVSVEFEMNAQLGVRVPVRLEERFWAGGSGEGKATYRNYRRFQTAARIVPPRP
jgi:hypothetical protein